ncbi:MAG TPA: hypothetical protein ACFYD4_16865 [Candidatus Wunengus sp. YC61]|uniref:hypothetical protein n=1 Tax=Candidatus Wunengus sp. YC61 TaxID=3367698 RepID=UPI004027B364
MDWKLRKGMKVAIWDATKKNNLGTGIYVDSIRVKAFGFKAWTPRFRIGKRIIHGYECWWIPVKYQ